MSSNTVFLIDDDASVRKALARLIKSAGYKVLTFASADAFLDDVVACDGPACLVLDIRMPGLTGLDLQGELQKRDAIFPIIFITGHGDIPTSVKAMKAGAVDFLPKPVDDKVLLEAIKQALARAVRERAQLTERQNIRKRLDTLTPREREVLEHVIAGQLNNQIAFDHGTVERTIKVHRARVMDKMRVGSVAELVRVAEKVGVAPKGGERSASAKI
jgi:FixJ family two-component response regulator